MEPARLDITVTRGATWRKLFTIMQPEYAYRPIVSVNQTAPLTLTVEHQLPLPRWPIWIEGSTSSDLNTDKKRQRFRIATVIDENTIELNGINGHNVKATSGYLVYQLPVDFEGCAASLVITSAAADIELTVSSGLDLGIGFISAELTDAQTQNLAPLSTYGLWVTHGNGERIQWLCGEFSIHDCKNDRSC